jgi:hypothetical protein
VNGEASIWTTAGGSLTELGVSVDGVTFKETLMKEPVNIDTYFKQPYDYQYSLTDAVITCDLVVWDVTQLNLCLGRLLNQTPGTYGPAGSLIVQGGFTFRLLIKSTPAGTGITGVEACHNFPIVFLDDAYEVKFGTERSIYKLIFRAMPAQQLSSTNGVVLWNTVCS